MISLSILIRINTAEIFDYPVIYYFQLFTGIFWIHWTRRWLCSSIVSTKFLGYFCPNSNTTLCIHINTSHGFRYGFGAYFTVLPGSEWSALMLTYGFPLAIIGMALKVCRLIFFADKLMFPQSILFSLIHFVVCRA